MDILDVAAVIDHLAVRHRATAMAVAANHGIAENLAAALWALSRVEESTMREVASSLRCDPSNATLLIDQLENRGLVERRTDPQDRRRRVVSLTREGFAVAREMGTAVVADSPLSQLSKSALSNVERVLAPVLSDS